jgi:hypothetical protein
MYFLGLTLDLVKSFSIFPLYFSWYPLNPQIESSHFLSLWLWVIEDVACFSKLISCCAGFQGRWNWALGELYVKSLLCFGWDAPRIPLSLSRAFKWSLYYTLCFQLAEAVITGSLTWMSHQEVDEEDLTSVTQSSMVGALPFCCLRISVGGIKKSSVTITGENSANYPWSFHWGL